MRAMASAIDHIVIAVKDPDAAAAELTETVGVAFTGGGRHTGLGTFNRIAFLGDAYLELLGVEDAALAANWAVGAAAVSALARGGGFATYALVDDAIRSSVARLQANGSRIGPVLQGSRERPDGERVEWWSATTPQLGPDQPPFLIKHLYAGAEWGADALAARRAFPHPIGSPAVLLGLDLAISDPIALAAACAIDVGMEFQSLGSMAFATVGRHVIRLTVAEPATPAAATATIRLAIGAELPRSLAVLGIGFELAAIAVV